jgi:hypothetical protein
MTQLELRAMVVYRSHTAKVKVKNIDITIKKNRKYK